MGRLIKGAQFKESCPIATVQYLLSGKWKIKILFLLSLNTRRFNELQRLCGGISQTILTKQLRELEDSGLVHREIYKEVPPKVEYSLTEIGKTFIPVINTMGRWGKDYMSLSQNSIEK